jgi:hypothetical protein
MRRTPIAAIGAVLALASAGAFAAAGDAWYGTNRFQDFAPIEVTRASPDHVIIYESSVLDPAPVIIERSYEPAVVYYYEPSGTVYLARVEDDWVKDLNPQTGQRVGDGLFNRQGPNDFGS